MKVRINRKHFIEIDNIDQIVESYSGILVYKKEGYPKILKADCSKNMLLIRMVNQGVRSEKIKELRDKNA